MHASTTDNVPGLTDAYLQWVRQLQLPWRTPAMNGIVGERRAVRGRGNEPELLRRYQYGDDVRRIDWPATLRLQRPTVRQPQAVMPGRIQVILDTSPSMHVIATKWACALSLYASIGVVATAHADMVCGVTDETISPWFIDTTQWLMWVNTVAPRNHAFRYVPVQRTQMTVLISDLWHDDASETITRIAQQTDQLIVIHLLAAAEEHPVLGGEVTLRDSERAEEITVTLTAELIARYQSHLAERRMFLRQHCHAHDADYVACHDQQSLVAIMTEVMQ